MKKTVLDNGLRVITEHLPHYRSVSFGVWVKTGSRYESGANNGISHLIEHMLFKGSEKYGVREIAETFDRIGGNVNAFTTKEYTCYYAKVLDEHLPVALDVFSDMFFRPKMEPGELEKEKNVIYEEISMYEDTPDDLVHDLVSKAAFGRHSLAFPILGTEDNISRMDSADLFQYMRTHYHMDNTVISAAGKVDERSLEAIRKYFDLNASRGKVCKPERPAFCGDVVFQPKQTEQDHICLALPGVSLSDDRLYAMVLLNNIIGGGMSSRLFQEIREKRGLAYSVYSYHSAHEDCGQFTIYIGTSPKQTKEVLEVAMDVFDQIRCKGILEEELAHGKEQMKGSLILSMESTGTRMNRLGKNELMLGRSDTVEQTLEKIESVQLEDLYNLWEHMLSEPFAVAMSGGSDRILQTFRRDQLVLSDTNSKIAGK